MRILIGYSMRSGSTLLQHLLNGHSRLRSYSDLSSLPVLAAMAAGLPIDGVCVKPLDVFFLRPRPRILKYFDRFVWLSRDPRDSYLSTVESKYRWLASPRRCEERGIDLRLLRRWQRIHRLYFHDPGRWHLVRYEDLTGDPDRTVEALLDYLGLEPENLLPFKPFAPISGGDMKLTGQRTVHTKSVARHLRQMQADQRALFERRLGQEMRRLGYLT